MYDAGREDELALRTFDLISAGLAQGFSCGEMTVRLIDDGLKPSEITPAIIMALENYPTEKLTKKDKELQIFTKTISQEIIKEENVSL